MTKKFLLMVVSCIAVLFASSCSSKVEPGSVDIKAEGVEGKSSEAIKIVGESTKLNMKPAGSDNQNQEFTAKVKIALAEQLPGFAGANIDDISADLELQILDANGGELLTLHLGTSVTDTSAKDEFKKLLTGEAGAEKEFTFSDNIGNEEMAAKVMSEAKSFKLVNADFQLYETGISSNGSSSASSADEVEDELEANGWKINDKGEIIDAAGKVIKSYKEAVSMYGDYYKYAMKAYGIDAAKVVSLYGDVLEAAEKMADMDVDDAKEMVDEYSDKANEYLKNALGSEDDDNEW